MKIPFKSLLLLSAAFLWCSNARAADGRELFAVHCASCHGIDGKAQTPMGRKLGAKSLTEIELDTSKIEKQISLGVKDEKDVFRMPAFDQRLTKEEIAALAVFVKSLRH